MNIVFALCALILLSEGAFATGWTDFTPSPDTRIVYVSNSQGSDSNSGLSEASPVKTINKGISLLRPGSPDWLLLKRGDIWTNEHLGYWNRQGGRSETEPMLISYYGDPNDPRPLLKTGGESGAKIEGVNATGNPDHRRVDYLAIVGLHFYAHTYDGTATDSWGIRPSGIRWFAGSNWVLIEDCLIEGYATCIVVQAAYQIPINNVVVRRNVLVDSYAVSTDALDARAQGIYTSGVHGLLIEENLMDHNGWKEGLLNAEPTIYGHNMYIQYENYNVVIRGNISARASSHGLQARPGGIVEGNLFIDNSIAFFASDGDGDGSDNVAIDNVVLHGSRKGLRPDGWPRGWGIDMTDQAGSECIRNIVAHGTDCTKALTGLTGVYHQDNIVYQWGTQSDPGPFSDPGRTIETYDTLIGGAGTLESFLNQARSMSRHYDNPYYTAPMAVRYFQSGFDLSANCIDLDGATPVNFADFAVMAADYSGGGIGDIEVSGTIDMLDVAQLALWWLTDCS